MNIYNGLLQDEAVSPSEVKEFADLSEQELDRIETLVQNLLKITRLDAGSVVFEKENENVAEMVQDIARQYNYRAEQEQKSLFCPAQRRLHFGATVTGCRKLWTIL